MSDYRRTSLRALKIQGYRSIENLELKDIPSLVVVHGQNGTGKSNILRAIRLALRVMGLGVLGGDLPVGSQNALRLPPDGVANWLPLRPEDFLRGGSQEIRIALEFEIGERGQRVIGAAGVAIRQLKFEVVFQNVDPKNMKIWVESGLVNDVFYFLPSLIRAQRALLGEVEAKIASKKAQIFNLSEQLERLANDGPREKRAAIEARVVEVSREIDEENRQVASLAARLGPEELTGERICSALLARQAVQMSPAERRPRDEPMAESEEFPDSEDPAYDDDVVENLQYFLYLAFTSENEALRDSVDLLSKRLGQIGLFPGQKAVDVRLRPIRHQAFKEYQLLLTHPAHKDLPLRNLSSGEQQIVLMLAQQVITPWPIAFLEEPEAHLHRQLMLPLAEYLSESVEPHGNEPPDVDQLWIATHHHAFAIAPTYLDVSLDAKGHTVARWRPREEAAPEHFYEPGPFLDALKALVDRGLRDDEIVFYSKKTGPVTAREVRESLATKEQTVANEFVAFANQQLVLSLTQEEVDREDEPADDFEEDQEKGAGR
jgi:hypothetical protein